MLTSNVDESVYGFLSLFFKSARTSPFEENDTTLDYFCDARERQPLSRRRDFRNGIGKKVVSHRWNYEFCLFIYFIHGC